MKTEEFAPGALIEIPGAYHPTHPGRPYCLLITTVMSVSGETGAVELVGEVRSLAGTTTRKRRLIRRVVVRPDRVTLRETAPQDQERES